MRYAKPQTVAQAASLLSEEEGLARVLAAGTDILVQMKSGIIDPDLILYQSLAGHSLDSA